LLLPDRPQGATGSGGIALESQGVGYQKENHPAEQKETT
jgi:hypothetical protein